MGSCRMATSARHGVVNPHGETFEVKGLYVSDASVFPTASGVNPMLTTYSVAHAISRFMIQDIGLQKVTSIDSTTTLVSETQ